MDGRYVFLMLGFLGSGKSHVSRWLTPHIGAVRLRADELRIAMFGEDRAELYTPANKALVNNASRYAMLQILKSGQANVVHDANHNAKSVRKSIARDVAHNGATAIIVHVQTPLELAKRRTEIRAIDEGHILFDPNIVEKMAKRLQQPATDELFITIDGQASSDAQKKSFDDQFSTIQQQIHSHKQDSN